MRSREEMEGDLVIREANCGYGHRDRRMCQDIRDLLDENARLAESDAAATVALNASMERVSSLQAECERLRGLVEQGWRTGWNTGFVAKLNGVDPTGTNCDTYWNASAAKAELKPATPKPAGEEP